jgi:hypothetical protein
MERTYLDEGVLISVLSNEGCELKFLTGKVIDDKTNRFQVGRFLITLQLELCGKDTFITKRGELFETSDYPSIIEVSCAELLLMRTNSFSLKQILDIRECTNKAKLIAAFDE